MLFRQRQNSTSYCSLIMFSVLLGTEWTVTERKLCRIGILVFLLDRGTDPVILLNLIKGSNLRLEICVCSVVSTVETSGAAGKW